MLTLYSYWRSSAAYRVRIALNLKGLAHDIVAVNLVKGEQAGDDYRALNPQGLVPLLVDGDTRLSQSMAIIEYLEEVHPHPRLLPADLAERARVRAMAGLIAADIHPLNNLRVLKYLKRELGQTDDAINSWYRHWITQGFTALEQLADATGPYLCGDVVTLADVFLVPQMANARRYDTDLTPFPRLVAADAAARALEPFAAAAPERQPDAG